MSESADHEVTAIELDDGVPVGDVPPDAVRSGLRHEDNQVRSHAAAVAAGLARRGADDLVELAPALCEAVRDDHRVVVFKSAIALAAVSEESPDRLEPALDRLVDLLGHDYSAVRRLSARALSAVALDEPDLLTDHADILVEATADEPERMIDADALAEVDYDSRMRTLQLINREHFTDDVMARKITAHLLVEVANADPDAVKPHVPTLTDLLSTRDASVLTAVADVLGTIAEDDPEAVAGAVDPLCDLLDHRDDSLVATVVTALGFAGDPAAVDPLRDLAADEERNEDLRDFATETADVLADGANAA